MKYETLHSMNVVETNTNVFQKKIKILLKFSKSVIGTKKCESTKSGKTFMMLNKIESIASDVEIYTDGTRWNNRWKPAKMEELEW